VDSDSGKLAGLDALIYGSEGRSRVSAGQKRELRVGYCRSRCICWSGVAHMVKVVMACKTAPVGAPGGALGGPVDHRGWAGSRLGSGWLCREDAVHRCGTLKEYGPELLSIDGLSHLGAALVANQ